MGDFALQIKDLTVNYGTHTALKGISFDLDEGSFLSIVGPNGGGKSTLIKVILGLVKPGSGTIKVFGNDPCDIPASWIGYVPQIKTLDRTFPAQPLELVASGILAGWPGLLNKDIKQRSMEALELVGAAHLASRPLKKLSGGELQRVYLARSFIRNPKILLLDEPATGIDVASESDLNFIIDRYKNDSGTTIIMITHDWESAYHHSDMVLLMNSSLVCYNKPEEAFQEKNLRRAFGHEGHDHDMMFGVRHHD